MISTMSSAWEHARTLALPLFVPSKWCSLESIPLGWDHFAWYMLTLWPRVKEQYHPGHYYLMVIKPNYPSTYKASAHITSPISHCQQVTWPNPTSMEFTTPPQQKGSVILLRKGHGCTLMGKWRIEANNPVYDNCRSYSVLQSCFP